MAALTKSASLLLAVVALALFGALSQLDYISTTSSYYVGYFHERSEVPPPPNTPPPPIKVSEDVPRSNGTTPDRPEAPDPAGVSEKVRPQEQHSATRRPVVLGMSTGYSWDQLQPFVVSLRRTARYTGDVVLFIKEQDRANQTLMHKFKQYNVKTECVTHSHPYFLPDSSAYEFSLSSPLESTPNFSASMLLRFPVLLLWLRAHRTNYSEVFITDTRDVLFQKDPFDWGQWNKSIGPLADKYYPVIENTRFRVGSNWMNAEWIRRHYKHEGVAVVGQDFISCSGTSYGSIDQMIHYLEAMTAAITEFIFKPADLETNDQPIHIWLLHHHDWEGKMERLIQGQSPVTTLALFDSVSPELGPDGVLVVRNEDGTIPCVVHQYDRHGNLMVWRDYYRKLDGPVTSR